MYYCFMNAAKALLSAKGIVFDEHHGVRAHRMRAPNSKIVLSNEGIRILNRGITPALSNYLGETTAATVHSLEDVLRPICGPSLCWRHWRWRSVSAGRAMSSTTATRAPSLSSTGRRNSSVRRFHKLVQSLGRCSPSKRLARTTIQRCRHGGKRVDAVHAQVRALRKVLAQ